VTFKSSLWHDSFPDAATEALKDSQLRRNVAHATNVIRNKRGAVVAEHPDWEGLRDAGAAIRDEALRNLDGYLIQFERECREAGGQVHWASDAEEANRIICEIVTRHAASEVLKIKSMTTEEVELNHALSKIGVQAIETDLAELIVQLGRDRPSHIVVPALHKNRQQVRAIFEREMKLINLGDSPEDLTRAARDYLRQKFFTVPVAISGVNFLIAETGSVVIVESEGNGRMCLTLPKVLISLAGIEKVIPRYEDLGVFLQTLPRSATGERMNPYNSMWTGVQPGDGPEEFHVVLLDNGRSNILRDKEARQTLRCIRCGACQNACPVYQQTGGHAYGSVYSGPIGAILTPQLQQLEQGASLPYASSLCGACYEVCPVKINIPEVLIHLRGQVVERQKSSLAGRMDPMSMSLDLAAQLFVSRRWMELAQRLGRVGQRPFVRSSGYIERLPFFLSGWTQTRDLTPIAPQTFREWWAERRNKEYRDKENQSGS
jgi:L-lactate dehydrogenase complex protein LldF